jgi:hypothetical protein
MQNLHQAVAGFKLSGSTTSSFDKKPLAAIVMEQEHSFVRSVRFNIKVPERGGQLDVCRRGRVDDESLILIRPRRGR